MNVGRPSEFTQEIADRICQGVADGVSLREVVAQNEDLPARSTIFRWLSQIQSFQDQYARAKEECADAQADDMIAIADEPPRMTLNKLGAEVVDTGYEAFRKTRIDTRKWSASKLKPKKYGDKVETTLQGPNGGPIKVEEIAIRRVNAPSD